VGEISSNLKRSKEEKKKKEKEKGIGKKR